MARHRHNGKPAFDDSQLTVICQMMTVQADQRTPSAAAAQPLLGVYAVMIQVAALCFCP